MTAAQRFLYGRAVFRATIATAAIILSLSALWAVGETRRRHCVLEHNTGCTILPWTGHYVAVDGPGDRVVIEPASAKTADQQLYDTAMHLAGKRP